MKTIKLLILSLLLLGTTLFANSIATITAIKGSATVLRDTSNIKAKLGLKLNVKDTIKTHDNTKVQIIFDDETIVSLGKNSNFSINEFLFDGDKEPVAKFAMLRGAMRVITGKIGKIAPQKFSVSTKTATIGIRGTNFTVIANDDGSYQVYCTYGAISVTINGVEYVVEQGYYINISPSGEAKILEFTPESLKQMRIVKFGLVQNRVAQVSEDGQSTDDKVSDDDPLNITINDNTEVVIQDISEQNSDNIQNATLSLSELLASYSMNNASYSGTSNGVNGAGTATLDIDFGANTADLIITDFYSTQTEFKNNPKFSGIGFTTTQTTVNGQSNTGTADGTFQETTGNEILGNYHIDGGYGSISNGTYDVSTNQTLH
jgi:hypothetical protein